MGGFFDTEIGGRSDSDSVGRQKIVAMAAPSGAAHARALNHYLHDILIL